MHLLIDNYGIMLEVEDGKFKISTGEAVRYASALKLSSICILKQCVVTTAALELAAENEVPVMIMNKYGKVTAWLWSPRYGTIADIRVKQAFFSKSNCALQWMQQVMKTKIQEQQAVLAWLNTRVISNREITGPAVEWIGKQIPVAACTQTMEQLRGVEAMVSKTYWSVISGCLEKYVIIPGRVTRGATDAFNVSLNYLYGLLYGQVETSLLMAGADPYLGFMHINRHARPALAFDHIEPFRPWIDKLVILAFMKTNPTTSCLEQGDSRRPVYLRDAWRKNLLNAYFSFMEQRSYLAGKRIKNCDHIHYLSKQLVRTLKKFNPDAA